MRHGEIHQLVHQQGLPWLVPLSAMKGQHYELSSLKIVPP